jgi:pilus assembly protein CpaF
MIAMANLNIPEKAIRQQVASAVDIVIQVTRLSDGTRRVTSISEITGMERDVITMQEIFAFQQTGINQAGQVVGSFRATGIRPKNSDRICTAGFKLPMDMFEHTYPINQPSAGRLR